MRATSKCLTCHVEQAQRIIDKFVTSEQEKWLILNEVLKELATVDFGVMPIDIAEILYKKLEILLKKEDLYKLEKEKSNKIALSLYNDFKLKVMDSSDPLYEAAKLAVAGNLIDFGALNNSPEEMFEKINELWAQPFSIDDFEYFKKDISNSNNLLYIVDNVGEAVFDMLFIETIKQHYNDLNISVALKGYPIINDATVEDALFIGLDKFANLINTGLSTPGTNLEKANQVFRDAFFEYEIILAKGQGNFEGLSDIKKNNIYFALVAKCKVISDYIKVAQGSKIFMNSKRIHQVL
ncbi:hypothetical protein SU69_07800 [Thermosipho melanesiensis]|uniref:Damage-control phosphatase ARMT1-like metal-binding domain-containing protein n=2 Tax=Thermosipho melanesiensis TaxID=46541 RepID=A6LN80_THEM4|nr:ARMT1-like domain-containing protein [Thermosipho melanesiensis]ABR31381.1 protein of unknown function DUF89 [Thermosipho melanesiensis BI429]APT74441.1 hypothetical protein BW47_08155 [Thermosipho melanesiensis]OOC36403.1 hypothetical protein SU68_07870 [Thermosipho melanesiensis]OOC37221.1 hypothetical protein SU69_07800 [Thermosipho melanesiensis]OOC37973.1 hypothetical protein SU70_07810 [Thermosipho melanesiensis]